MTPTTCQGLVRGREGEALGGGRKVLGRPEGRGPGPPVGC